MDFDGEFTWVYGILQWFMGDEPTWREWDETGCCSPNAVIKRGCWKIIELAMVDSPANRVWWHPSGYPQMGGLQRIMTKYTYTDVLQRIIRLQRTLTLKSEFRALQWFLSKYDQQNMGRSEDTNGPRNCLWWVWNHPIPVCSTHFGQAIGAGDASQHLNMATLAEPGIINSYVSFFLLSRPHWIFLQWDGLELPPAEKRKTRRVQLKPSAWLVGLHTRKAIQMQLFEHGMPKMVNQDV